VLRLNPSDFRLAYFAIVPPSFWLLATRHRISGSNGAKSVRASYGGSARQDNDIHRPII
jgi:hypothetical protein